MIKLLISNLPFHYSKSHTLYKKILKDLIKKNKNIDRIIHLIHNEIFDNIDCLDCGNCCKSISPIITYNDVNRISKIFKIKPSLFVEKYLNIDSDQDYVFKHTPCPFIDENNYCKIYEDRPKACREYPHTNRKKFHQIVDLTIRNLKVCPAVFLILEKLEYKV